jgi:hypothetical protein
MINKDQLENKVGKDTLNRARKGDTGIKQVFMA